MDIVVPIVFPDYEIAVNIPPAEVDLFPWFEFDNFTTPRVQERLSNLGHAGVLFVNGKTGLTKYYEYGRYDRANLGLVRRLRIPDARSDNGSVPVESLKAALRQISRLAGHHGRIEGVFVEVENGFPAMLKYAETRKINNRNPARPPYDILTNSCIHFVKNLMEVAGVDTPWMLDPRPNSYIGEFRDDYRDLNYDYRSNTLTVESHGQN